MVISEGSPAARLTEADLRSFMQRFLAARKLDGKRVLAVIPDHTRSGPTGTWFQVIAGALNGRARQIDFLIALGTHQPLKPDKIDELLKMPTGQRELEFPGTRVFNHDWESPATFRQVGMLTKRQVEELSNGLLSIEVPVRINKLIDDYDHVIICGPVFPHEVVGFSGGHKYFFPGIAAPEVINFTHWLGALLTNPVVNGTRDTRVRAAIEACADLVGVERSLIGYVVSKDDVAGVFGGDVRETWRAATELSEKIHIQYIDKPYHTILSCSPKMYDDIWTAGKCMYKMEPVVADGGTLIIYAPHIDEVSYSHGKVLDDIGYHTRDYFVRQWSRFESYPWGVVAHSTHVKGIGTFNDNVERPRVSVVLATKIPKARCERVNLGHVAIESVRIEEYANREAEGILMVPKAGEILYRLKDMSRFG